MSLEGFRLDSQLREENDPVAEVDAVDLVRVAAGRAQARVRAAVALAVIRHDPDRPAAPLAGCEPQLRARHRPAVEPHLLWAIEAAAADQQRSAVRRRDEPQHALAAPRTGAEVRGRGRRPLDAERRALRNGICRPGPGAAMDAVTREVEAAVDAAHRAARPRGEHTDAQRPMQLRPEV